MTPWSLASGALTFAASSAIDLNALVIALLTTVAALAAAGLISTRRSRLKIDAEIKNLSADSAKKDGETVLSHAQYEGFIAEAAQRLSTMQEATLARLEAELERAQRRIAELETELERAKAARNQAFAEAAMREGELKTEIAMMRDRIADLERRLESQGIKQRRHTDEPTDRPESEEGGRDTS